MAIRDYYDAGGSALGQQLSSTSTGTPVWDNHTIQTYPITHGMSTNAGTTTKHELFKESYIEETRRVIDQGPQGDDLSHAVRLFVKRVKRKPESANIEFYPLNDYWGWFNAAERSAIILAMRDAHMEIISQRMMKESLGD